MKLKLHMKFFLLISGLFFYSLSFALSLGSLSVESSPNENLQAKIAILMSAQESKSLGTLQANLANRAAYEKFGIPIPSNDLAPQITIQNDNTGKASAIVLKFSKNNAELEKAFNDIVIELTWSSGSLVRVYTVLNTQAKEIKVQAGDNLVNIVNQAMSNIEGVDFNQTLVALYRLNPKAFFAGNIHRLKQGETLQLPTATMAASIPEQEAREFVASGAKNYQDRQFNNSSDAVLKANNRTYQQAQLKDSFKDRLKIGSSQTETEQSVNQAKLNEDVIAQQKMLEEAQQRIAELERNIADLKEINAKKIASSQSVEFRQYGLLIGILGLTGIFLFGVLRRSTPDQLPKRNVMPVAPSVEKDVYFPSLKVPEEEVDEPVVSLSQEAQQVAHQQMPDHVKQLFTNIDLNLPTAPTIPPTPTPPIIALKSPSTTEDKPKGIVSSDPFSLDLNVVNPHPDSTSVVVPQPTLNTDEQKVRLNLARSYIKIKDFETARILLTDLVQLGTTADTEVLAQASQLLMEIS
jgi:pilus assembly protein FimV